MMQRVFGSTIFLFSSFTLGVIACEDEGCEDKCLENCRRKCKLTYFAQVCYEGQCLSTNYTEKCKKVYGKDYLGIENPKETCCFTCVSPDECYKTYKEYISDGTKCLVDHSDEPGTCRAGICVKRRTVNNPFTGKFDFFIYFKLAGIPVLLTGELKN
ncbi:UNVERIFIED_CONTAM: hypothetical protein NCL1_41005 [Trichonephila clavipes]